MTKEESAKEKISCPIGKCISAFGKQIGTNSQFHTHMQQSRIEFLKAIRSMIDKRIDIIHQKKNCANKKKATKIEVE